MSTDEYDSLSEREFANELEGQIGEILGITPRSPGEAVAAQEEEPQYVEDVPAERPTAPDEPAEAPVEAPPEQEPEEEDVPVDEGLAWAKRKYGDDVSLEKISKVAFDQEQTISRLGQMNRENEKLATDWYQYSQNLEAQMQRQPTGMPISAAEEQWIEQSLVNPLQYALQAKMQGNEQLYRGVIQRISQEDPVVAGQVASQVEMTYAAEQFRAQAPQQEASTEEKFQSSLNRIGVNVEQYGQPMMAKIQEMGEWHPYTQAILNGGDSERDLAFQAVYDLVREGKVTRKAVRDTEREEALRKEGDLRRQAAGVLTGGPRAQTPPAQSPFMDAMEAEWRRAGQWRDD